MEKGEKLNNPKGRQSKNDISMRNKVKIQNSGFSCSVLRINTYSGDDGDDITGTRRLTNIIRAKLHFYHIFNL